MYACRNVDHHAQGTYHLAALGLEARMSTTVATLPIQLPVAVIPQVRVLFRTVIYMVKNSVAHRQLGRLLAVQRANGVVYNLRYKSSYVVVVLQFLASVVRKYLRQMWMRSVWRAVMTDEVKVGTNQWLAVMARLFLDQRFYVLPVAAVTLSGEGRDAPAIEAAMDAALAENGIPAWVDAALVALTVDGASVLISALADRLREKGPNALRWYCAAHRTQRVDEVM